MSLPFPIPTLGPPDLLSVPSGASPPQAPLGFELVVAADGTASGALAWPVCAGDSFAVRLSGELFRAAAIGAGVLSLAIPGAPATAWGSGIPPGGDLSSGMEFRMEGPATTGASGWVPAQIRLTLADGAGGVVLRAVCYISPPIDLPSAITRARSASLAITCTNQDGSAYDLRGMDLVWTCGGLSTATPPCTLVVLDAPGGQVQVTLPGSQTRRLVAGPQRWQLVDRATGRTVAQGEIQVL
jgi:hypothetical protein